LLGIVQYIEFDSFLLFDFGELVCRHVHGIVEAFEFSQPGYSRRAFITNPFCNDLLDKTLPNIKLSLT